MPDFIKLGLDIKHTIKIYTAPPWRKLVKLRHSLTCVCYLYTAPRCPVRQYIPVIVRSCILVPSSVGYISSIKLAHAGVAFIITSRL